ncbi:MAG: PAS domain-containing protein [Planctomycetota bacterium]
MERRMGTTTEAERDDAPLRFQTAMIEHILRGGRGATVLEEVCQRVEEIVPHAIVSIMIRDKSSGALEVLAGPSLPAKARADLCGLVPGEFAGSCGTAVYTGRAVIVGDTRTDPRWAGLQDFANEIGIRACWSVPVVVNGDEILGTVAISRREPGLPAPGFREILDAAEHVVGLAILQERDERTGRERSQLLSAVVEGSGDAICARDLEGRIVFANAAAGEELGVRPEDMIGHVVDDFFPVEAARRSRETDGIVIREGRSLLTTFSGREVLGEDRTIQVRKSPRFDHRGDIVGVISITRDLTEKVQAERAMQQMQKLESIGVLANGIAHDFNNILVGILGNAEWALGQLPAEGPLRESLHEIHQAALRAADLTRQIMAYSGRGSVARESLDLAEVVRDVLKLVGSAISVRARVQVEPGRERPTVSADGNQIRQVLMNLLINASDALEGRSGTIDIGIGTVTASPERPIRTVDGRLPEGSYVGVGVRDSGVGMSEQTVARIFDPFFTTKREGRGVGLAAVLGILKAHGGGIAVDSIEGRGSEFRVYLPAEPERAPAGRAEAPVILVVDDEGLVRKTARRLLESGGHRVRAAAGAVEARSIVREWGEEIALALIDLDLGDGSGRELAAELAASRPGLPVVLTTGGFDEVPSDREGSAPPLLRKPYSSEQLLSLVRRLLTPDAGR